MYTVKTEARVELGFLIVLGGVFLIFVFFASCLISLKKMSSEDLVEEYLSVGLRELKTQVETQLRSVEKRESLLREKLEHLKALEQIASEKLEKSSDLDLLRPEGLKDAV